jgi:hypothetical protein
MEKIKKKYLSLFIKYTQNDNIIGVSSPFLLLHEYDTIYKEVKIYLEKKAESEYKLSNIYNSEIKNCIKKKNRMKFYIKGINEQDVNLNISPIIEVTNNTNNSINTNNTNNTNNSSGLNLIDNCLLFEAEIKNIFVKKFKSVKMSKKHSEVIFKYSLCEIISEFFIDCSNNFSPNFHSVIVGIIVELRNAYNNYSWKYISEMLIESSELKKYLFNSSTLVNKDFNNNNNNNEEDKNKYKFNNSLIELSSIKGAYHFLPEILDFFIFKHAPYVIEDMDYVIILLVVNYFTDWCYFNNYLINKVALY